MHCPVGREGFRNEAFPAHGRAETRIDPRTAFEDLREREHWPTA